MQCCIRGTCLEKLRQRTNIRNKTPTIGAHILGAHWSADCLILRWNDIVISIVTNKNRQVSLLKKETIGILLNWYHICLDFMYGPLVCSQSVQRENAASIKGLNWILQSTQLSIKWDVANSFSREILFVWAKKTNSCELKGLCHNTVHVRVLTVADCF